MLLALTDTQEDLWWGAIVGGAVVIVAVVVLLTMLVMLVRTIERRVEAIKDTLERAAANTADTALIAETAAQVDGVLAEGLQVFDRAALAECWEQHDQPTHSEICITFDVAQVFGIRHPHRGDLDLLRIAADSVAGLG